MREPPKRAAFLLPDNMGIMKLEFIASLPDILTAITISGEGATRVKFDIPESEIANAVKLVMLKGQAFRVRIETLKEGEIWRS